MKARYPLCLLTLPTLAPALAAAQPMNYWRTSGPAADPVTHLNWGLTAISVAVAVIIAVLVLLATYRSRPPLQRDADGRLPVGSPHGGMKWVYIGTAISAVVLLLTTVWNTLVLSAVASPPQRPALEITVSAHQWWWGLTYQNPQPSQIMTSANEIHIPVGQPVRINLESSDVIHSFWVPQLAGKTDVIPGQVNHGWLQASHPGTYRGQCAEFCGAQHAHMIFAVVADEPARFEAWRQAQLAPAAAPVTPDAQRGRGVYEARCALCHTVRTGDPGTQGTLGPDLTHLMSRATIAAGTLANNTGNLHGWIANPQALKPGTQMPATGLTSDELHDVVAYLQTLR
jgi:cytochrome c oxidase subunit II